AVKPVAEEPEEGDRESRREEREGSEQAGHGTLRDSRTTADIRRRSDGTCERSVSRSAAGCIFRVDRDLHASVLLPAGVRPVRGDRLSLAAARRRDAGAIDTLRCDETRGRQRAPV